MSRIDIHSYFLLVATTVSLRGTCSRLRVGCVLVNKRNHIVATGYNGRASGLSHCIEKPCAGARIQTGMGTNTCEAIHAEANALLQCSYVHEIRVAYVTHSPCRHCIKLLLNTSCRTIFYETESSGIHTEALALWKEAGRGIYLLRDWLKNDQNQ